MEKLKGGISDKKTLSDIAIKHTYDDSRDRLDKGEFNNMLKHLKKQLNIGISVESEHTNNELMAREIAMDHLSEDPNYYTNLKQIETKESMDASASGSFEGAFSSGPIVKRKIDKIHNFEGDLSEVTDASSSGQYDVSFSTGRSNPLKINGPKSILNSRAVKDKNFPKWGGPGGVYVKVKEKCKRYPYCNQGDIKSLDFFESEELKESVKKASNKLGLPYSEVEKIVINEINKIFIK
jgi:hypothetical protein